MILPDSRRARGMRFSRSDVTESHRVNTNPDIQPVLRFPGHEHSDLVLARGMNGLCRDPDFDRGLILARDGARSLVDFCFDVRGLWLHVAEGVHGVHVNGRPVRSLALLRLGDSIHCEGVEMQLVDRRPRLDPGHPPAPSTAAAVLPVPVLRGICGADHGRACPLDGELAIGADGVAASDGSAMARLRRDGVDVWLDVLDAGRVQLNAMTVDRVRLRHGDQLRVGGNRYVLEASALPAAGGPDHVPRATSAAEADLPDRAAHGRHVPWLLVAAILSAAALAALLWFGVR